MGSIRNLNSIRLTFLVLIFFLASTGRAHAYLDPGTGSYILQILAAGVLGGLFAIKTFWRQIIGFLTNVFSRKKKSPAQKNRKKNNVGK